MLAIIKAAREYLNLDKANDKHQDDIVKNQIRKEEIVRQWGDALTATIAEIKDKRRRGGIQLW